VPLIDDEAVLISGPPSLESMSAPWSGVTRRAKNQPFRHGSSLSPPW
jgi:hypothetical protein